MKTHQKLKKLQVIGIPFANATPSAGFEEVLAAYETANVYQKAGVPVLLRRPTLDDADRRAEETENIGLVNGSIADIAAAARQNGGSVLMTGGNCCHITGILGGLQDAHGPNTRIGLVWFDAHGDFNTPNTTLSGMLGGMQHVRGPDG
ncbi:MAG: arginase family protein, partial [Chloroflexota bacterium]